MNDKDIFENVYEKPGKAIWTNSEPHKLLVDFIKDKNIKPCKVLDIGCGEGTDAIYLASIGFDVTGIDLSENAIKYAIEKANNKSQKVNFFAHDINDLDQLNEKYDFILDFFVLHHIPHKNRDKFVRNVLKLLNPDGIYLSICFNNDTDAFGNHGKKHIISHLGTNIYLSTFKELDQLFSKNFKILDKKVIEIIRKKSGTKHISNYFYLQKP